MVMVLDLTLPVQIPGEDEFYMDMQSSTCTECPDNVGVPAATFKAWPFIVLYVVLALSAISIVRQLCRYDTVKVGDRVVVSIAQPHKEEIGEIKHIGEDAVDLLMKDDQMAYDVQIQNVKDHVEGKAYKLDEFITIRLEVDDASFSGKVDQEVEGKFKITYDEEDYTLMSTHCEDAAVFAVIDKLEDKRGVRPKVSIASIDGPNSVVIAGPELEVVDVMAELHKDFGGTIQEGLLGVNRLTLPEFVSKEQVKKSGNVFSAGVLAKAGKYLQRQRKHIRMQAKLFLTLMQIVGSVKENLGSKFPPVFSKLLVVFDIVNFDFLPSLNLACTMQFGASRATCNCAYACAHIYMYVYIYCHFSTTLPLPYLAYRLHHSHPAHDVVALGRGLHPSRCLAFD